MLCYAALKVAYADMCRNAWSGACDNYGRDSWDPNTVYVAIMGAVPATTAEHALHRRSAASRAHT